jgi:hypothetical protein
MKQRLARKILSRMTRKGDAIKIYGKGKCRVAFSQYYGYYLFYLFKYRKDLREHQQNLIDICNYMYYKRFHKFGARTCRIRLTPRKEVRDEPTKYKK